MRPLTEEETQTVFKKLAEYTGASLKNLIAPLDDGPNADRNVFRLSQGRVYIVRLSMANLATSVARDNLLSLGTCLGNEQPSWIPQECKHLFANLAIVHRKIHKDWPFPNPHHSSPRFSFARTLQDLDSPQRCHALPVWLQCRQGSRRPFHRGLPRAPGRCCIHYG